LEYIEDQTLTELPAQLSEVEFTEVIFKNIDFKESYITGCLFIDCKFENCNLSNSKFPGCTFRDTSFKSSRVSGINWTEASNLVSFNFDDCQINYSVFLGMNLDNFKCINSQAKGCDFSECSLKNADFSKTDLSETSFHHANLEKASFSDAKQYYIDPSVTKLKDAVFSYPEALSLLNSFKIKIDNLS
tara:strand:- start:549763 stop:550326 length:564 start_codon:yes stop_codon:yes gene_type:complete